MMIEFDIDGQDIKAEAEAAEEPLLSPAEPIGIAEVLEDDIVGIQHYKGEVNLNEMVELVREPHNEYDKWAIRVDNVRGVKVGHLPARLACHLAPLMDQGLLQLEGLVHAFHRPPDNKYKLPVLLSLFCEPSQRDAVHDMVNRAKAAKQAADMQRSRYQRPTPPKSPSWVADSRSNRSGRRRSDAGSDGGFVAAAPVEVRLSQKEMDDGLARLWDMQLQSGPRQRLKAGPEVVTPLYPHQQEALAWMVHRENSNCLPPFWEPRVVRPGAALTYISQLTRHISTLRPPPLRGGILADDMGLGKTLEVICLIATNCPGVSPYNLRTFTAADSEQEAQPVGSSAAAAGQVEQKQGQQGLEQAQVIDLTQEREDEGGQPSAKRLRMGKEAARSPASATARGSSQQGSQTAQQPSEAERRAAEAEGAPSLPTADGPRATLIVCPVSVMSNWATQLAEHCSGTLAVCMHYGPDRNKQAAFLASHDVVITSYAILAQEAGTDSGVSQVDWLRVCLDEAQHIKNATTKAAQAAYALSAQRRWAVTGTPVVNSLQDLHSMSRFLRIDFLQDKNLFVRTIERPIKEGEAAGLTRLRVLMGAIALRRTKQQQVDGRPLVELPQKTVYRVVVKLDPASRAKYTRWQEAGREIVQYHLQHGTLLANYIAVLEILLRLRQICCHASLAPGEDPSFLEQQQQQQQQGNQANLLELLRAGLNNECASCLAVLETPCITPCQHAFCRRCIDRALNRIVPACPMCSSPISAADVVELPAEALEPAPQDGTSGSIGASTAADQAGYGSPKVEALLYHLRRDAAASAAAEPGVSAICSIVFSQFTKFLDVVQAALRAEGFHVSRLDGSTSAKKRGEVLRAFQSGGASSPTVLLVSLKAGGVGLNLTAASRVHLLDPWWNAAVEDQACDRVHRLGQTRDVLIYRYCVENSIEERMIALQEQKKDLISLAFDRRTPEEVRQSRLADVRMLMEIK